MSDVKKIMEVGRTCVRTAGRYAGKKGTITKRIDDNFVEVTYKLSKGEKIKKTNIQHLLVLNEKATTD
ncbi:MAG: hypothetical protein KAQ92_02000 [Candidatus Aenigmarchaeota archaeon]|nr:hypothetical protein [Candidatus Aenigmarchaeota archaeon]